MRSPDRAAPGHALNGTTASQRLAFALAAALGLLLAACSGTPKPQPSTPPPSMVTTAPPVVAPPAANALAAGVSVNRFDDLPGWRDDSARHQPAFAAFARSCAALQKREDRSGLTRPGDWAEACAAVQGWNPAEARRFLERYLRPVAVAGGSAFATGYYEPEISGSRVPALGYAAPVYRRPPDLVEADLTGFGTELKGRKLRGRFVGDRLMPYPDRGAIYDGALAAKGLEIAWAADPIELFFLQIQGSGRLLLPDGGVMRIGYDGQNGRDYLPIGRSLRDAGLLAPGQATMDGIIAWLRANPAEGAALMRQNKSYVFFRELTGDGPLGAMGVPLTPGASVAADPLFVPLGAPLWLELGPAAGTQAGPRAWVTQDTGGAIKGANRFDTFWGAGPAARMTAGGMSASSRAWLLLPAAAAARLEQTPRTGQMRGAAARP